MPSREPASFRPGFGRGLTRVIALIATLTAVISLFSSGLEAVALVWPWLALLVGSCWMVFWHPQVRVDDHGVTLVNVWHSVDVPWGAMIGIETKWALTLVTPQRRYRAWAAPAPGRSVMRNEHPNTHRLRDAAIGGEIRPGDLPHVDSGAAANLVRERWTAVRESGALDDIEPASDSVTLSIHWRLISAGAVLGALAVAGLA
jgi:hypothetical protein